MRAIDALLATKYMTPLQAAISIIRNTDLSPRHVQIITGVSSDRFQWAIVARAAAKKKAEEEALIAEIEKILGSMPSYVFGGGARAAIAEALAKSGKLKLSK